MNLEHRRFKILPSALRPIWLIPAFGLLLVVAIWAAALKQLSVDRQVIVDREMRATQGTSVAFEKYTLRVLKDADRSALRVKSRFEAAGNVNLQELMSSSLLPADEIESVNIVSAAGDVIASTRDMKPINVADREYFQRHRARDTGRLAISEPLVSRVSQEPTILLSRRLNSAEGGFAGVVVLALRPGYFTSFYQESQLGKHGFVGVLGRDGTFRAWRTGIQPAVSPDGSAARLFTMSTIRPHGDYQGKSAIDGVERLVAYRTLEDYPLVVAVGEAVDEILVDFYRQRVVYFAIAALASAAIFGFFAIVTLLVVRLRRSREEIREQRRFLLTIVDNIPVGVSVHGARAATFGKVVLWNAANEIILGVPRERAVGKTLAEVLPPAGAARVEECDRELLASPMVQEFAERTGDLPGRAQRHLHIIRAPIFDAQHQVEYIISITNDITQEKERANTARLASKVFETTADGIIMSDSNDRIVMVNAAFSRLTGYAAHEIVGEVLAESPFRPIDPAASEAREELLRRDGFVTGEVPRFRKDGVPLSLWITASCVRDADGNIRNYIRVFTDISKLKSSQQELESLAGSLSEANTMLTGEIAERTRAASALHHSNEELLQINVKLQELQGQVLQSEKLASIGQLAAGVAHEINNPIGYVLSNFGTLEGYIHNLFAMLAAYEAAEGTSSSDESIAGLAALREKIELDYLKEDIPTLMNESREGISRVRKIVEDLKDFSRTDMNQEWVWANLHSGINSTLNIVSNEIKYKAEVVKEYGNLPDIECLPTQLNQVFMNLLVNAAHSINKPRGRIVIRSGTEGDEAWVEVADDGCGMSPGVQARVFDPFFTTKPVGQGTGLGLSLTYGIIQKHDGRIELASEVGKGTTFRVWLPIHRRAGTGKVQARPAHHQSLIAAAAA